MELSIIKGVISDFQNRMLPQLTPRELALPYMPYHATAVVGVRRCGKTFRTYQAINEQIANGIAPDAVCRVQFNDDRLSFFNASNLHIIDSALFSLHPHLSTGHAILFVFDEIQHIDGWEKYVLSLIDNQRYRLLLTGSTSSLLSGAFESGLRGKVLAQTLYGYSFREFLRHLNIPADTISTGGRSYVINAFNRFLDQGGFPGLMGLDKMFHAETLQSYWSTMLLRDIIEAHPDERIPFDTLSLLARHLASRIACPTSVTRIAADLRITGHGASIAMLYRLVRYMREAFQMYLIPCHDPSQRVRDRGYKKAYAADWALALAVSPSGAVSHSRMLENMVFIELLRRRYEVAYLHTKQGGEIDFIASSNGACILIIQVCLNLTPENRGRELDGLPQAARYLGVSEAWVVTLDQEEELAVDGVKIHIVPAWQWLLAQ